MKTNAIKRENPPYPGFLYVPDAPGPHPGILLLHGSEGGHGDYWNFPGEASFPTGESSFCAKLARHFSSLGFVAFAYSYFHSDGIKGFSNYPPKELAHIEIQNTARAFAWLKNSSHIQGGAVGLWGGSRGAEHALLLGSVISQLKSDNIQIDVIVAEAPCDLIYPGFSLEAAKALSTGAEFPENPPPAWKLNDQPLQMYVPIEIEKIKAPILITYGAEDPIWGPQVAPEKLHQRLISNGIPSLHFDFQNSDDPKAHFDSIVQSLLGTQAIFIRFQDEGHNPRPDTNSHRLNTLLREYFLKNYLSGAELK